MADGEVTLIGDGGSESNAVGVQKLNTCSNTDVSGKSLWGSGIIVGNGTTNCFPGHGCGEGVSVSEGDGDSEEGRESGQVHVTGEGPGGGHTLTKVGGDARVRCTEDSSHSVKS